MKCSGFSMQGRWPAPGIFTSFAPLMPRDQLLGLGRGRQRVLLAHDHQRRAGDGRERRGGVGPLRHPALRRRHAGGRRLADERAHLVHRRASGCGLSSFGIISSATQRSPFSIAFFAKASRPFAPSACRRPPWCRRARGRGRAPAPAGRARTRRNRPSRAPRPPPARPGGARARARTSCAASSIVSASGGRPLRPNPR